MDMILSLVMLAAFALIAGAAFLWFRKRARKQAGLMALLALIMLINVAIWTIPDAGGNAPLDQVQE
jgi:drug/metabolite transporter superfamily protein YnfA